VIFLSYQANSGTVPESSHYPFLPNPAKFIYEYYHTIRTCIHSILQASLNNPPPMLCPSILCVCVCVCGERERASSLQNSSRLFYRRSVSDVEFSSVQEGRRMLRTPPPSICGQSQRRINRRRLLRLFLYAEEKGSTFRKKTLNPSLGPARRERTLSPKPCRRVRYLQQH
jgi:hypothetical protein